MIENQKKTMHENAALAIGQRIANGTLARGQWTGTDVQGRQIACLLATISPQVGEAESARYCPADTMPEWLAHLTVWIDDAPSDDQWLSIVTEYSRLFGLSWRLTDEAWRRLDYTARKIAVVEERSRVDANRKARGLVDANRAKALAAIDVVLELLEHEIRGDSPATAGEWQRARAAANNYWAYAAAYAASATTTGVANAIANAANAAAGCHRGADRICHAFLAAWAAEIELAGGAP